jgi:transcriptional regulator with XRE-family HTH domain
MSKQSAVQVFDVQAFMDDVERFRKRRGWSQNEMADVCGVSSSTVKMFAQGNRPPGLFLACVLADVCDLSLDKYRTDKGI